MSKNEMPSHHGSEDLEKKHYPNDTVRILCERASLRNFSKHELPEEVLNLILEAGIHSPTGGNLQPYSIIKIQNKETKKKLADLCEQNFIEKAPVDLLFCIDLHRIKRWTELELAPFTATSSFRHFWISFQDTVIAAQNIVTAADALGLGSVYVGTIIDFIPEIKKMFELPEGVFPVVLLSLGYPASKPLPRKKLGIDAIVHNEKYEERKDEELLQVFSEKYSEIKIPITKERLEKIYEVSKEVYGEDFAKKCIAKIKENGYINAAQRYFGLHYVANEMPKNNEDYLRFMEEAGFNWFKKFETKK
jgi:FMN reductase [NAD(P)H]